MLQVQETHAITPACAKRGELHIEKYFEESAAARAFHRLSSVYIFGEVLNAAKGNVVVSKWRVQNAAGLPAGKVIGIADIPFEEEGSYDISFCVQPPPQGWQPGEYSVEVYFNGLLAASYVFSIR